jgi:hypothetical protein
LCSRGASTGKFHFNLAATNGQVRGGRVQLPRSLTWR